MRTLHLKVLREARRNAGQVVAVAAVICAGIATWVTMRTAYESLLRTLPHYYASYRFADVFAQVRRAPEPMAERIRAIGGVAEAETRLVYEVVLDVPGLVEPATGRLISLPERGEPRLNRVHLRSGRTPEPGTRNEALASEAFMNAHGLRPGATVRAVLNGRWTQLHITGVAISPEYIYELRSGAFFPDSLRFGVFWMRRAAMEAAFQMSGAFNDVSLTLAPGAREAAVIEALDRLLDGYGSAGAYGRSDHLSHRFISDEIRQDRVSGIVVPGIFLGIAAWLTHMVVTRMVARQREYIATLKAFGYSNAAVGLHYALFALVPVGLGTAAGIPLGAWLGQGLARLYAEFFRFPRLEFEVDARLVLLAAGISTAAALAGALMAVRSVVLLPPAEAMRPERPPEFRAGMLERLGLARWLPLEARMIARGIGRRPVKSAVTVLGVGMAIGVLLVARYFTDALEFLTHVQFELIQRDSATVTFQEPRTAAARFALSRMTGVLRVEPFRAVPARLRAGHRTYRTAIQGLPRDGELHVLVDADLRRVPLPEQGLAMSAALAAILRVAPGDEIEVSVLEGSRPVRRVRLAATFDDLVGVSVYMALDGLSRLLGEGGAISGAALLVDEARSGPLFAALKSTPAVNSVTAREVMVASFRKTVAESMSISVRILEGFALLIAVSIVYNSIRIALSERSHELASLRVLGFSRSEVAVMLLGEHLLLSVLAIPAGFAIGYASCMLLSAAMESELYRMPVVLSRQSYLYSLQVLVAATAFSAAMVGRGVWKLDLVRALKTRE